MNGIAEFLLLVEGSGEGVLRGEVGRCSGCLVWRYGTMLRWRRNYDQVVGRGRTSMRLVCLNVGGIV